GLGQRVSGEDHLTDVLGGGGRLARELEHRRGSVGGDDPLAGLEQVPGQQTAAAPQREHEAVSLAHGLEQGQDPGRRGVSVEPEPQVVHEGEVVAVVERVGSHGDKLCPVTTETINGTTLAYDVAGDGATLGL